MVPKRHLTSQLHSTHASYSAYVNHVSCKLRCRICLIADVRIGIRHFANVLSHAVVP